MKYEIWIEGYAATGESATASKVGEAEGETFEEACQNFVYPEGHQLAGEGLPLDKEGHGGRPSIWACRMFDNEADARKSFG